MAIKCYRANSNWDGAQGCSAIIPWFFRALLRNYFRPPGSMSQVKTWRQPRSVTRAEISQGCKCATFVRNCSRPFCNDLVAEPSQSFGKMRVERLHLLLLGGMFKLLDQWKVRRMPLACPKCLKPSSQRAFARGRWLVSEKKLGCDRCGVASDIAGWRLAADYQDHGDKFPIS